MFMRIVGLELRDSIFRAVAPILAIAGTWIAFAISPPVITSWGSVSEVITQTVGMLTPFVSAAAAWAALRSIWRRVSHPSELSVGIFTPVIYLPRLISSLIYVGTTFGVIFVAVLIRSLFIGLYGLVDVAPLILSLALPMIFTVIGASLAAAIRNGIAIIVAFILPVLVQGSMLGFLSWTPDTFVYTNFFRQYVWYDYWIASPIYYLILGIEALALMVLLAVFALWRHPQYRFRSGLAAVVSAITLVTSGYLAINIGREGRVSIPEAEQPYVTVQNKEKSVSLRILPYYLPVANRLSETWGKIANRFKKTPYAFTELKQDAQDPTDNSRIKGFRLQSRVGDERIVDGSVYSAFSSISSCFRAGSAVFKGNFGDNGNMVFSGWLFGKGSPGHSRDPLQAQQIQSAWQWINSLSESQARDWVSQHLENIKKCQWNKSDFGL